MIITEASHLLRQTPTLFNLEEAGHKDPEYKLMIGYIRTYRNFKELPSHFKGFRMGLAQSKDSTRGDSPIREQ